MAKCAPTFAFPPTPCAAMLPSESTARPAQLAQHQTRASMIALAAVVVALCPIAAAASRFVEVVSDLEPRYCLHVGYATYSPTWQAVFQATTIVVPT